MIGVRPVPLEAERSRTVIVLELRSSYELKISDVIQNGQIQLFPYVEQKGLVFLQFRKNSVNLSAGPYIGLIPITPNIELEIKPRLPVANLACVIDAARSSLSGLTGVDRRYLAEITSSPSILEFLARNLLDAVGIIAASGLCKEFVRVLDKTGHPRGHIEMVSTLRACWSRGHRNLLCTSRFDQTADIVVNRIVKAALRLILTRRHVKSQTYPKLIASLNEAYLSFPASVSILRSGDIEACKAIIKNNTLPQNRSYYYRALDISLLILSSTGISIQRKGEDIALGSFIINFEELFEVYIRRILQDRSGSQFWVRDGNKEGRKALFDDRREPPAQPDIVVIERRTKHKLVAEVKYKDRPSREDINQSITYAVSYRTRRAVLIHQNRPGAPHGLQKIGTVNEIELNSYAYDLAAVDLDAEENSLANCIFALAESH